MKKLPSREWIPLIDGDFFETIPRWHLRAAGRGKRVHVGRVTLAPLTELLRSV